MTTDAIINELLKLLNEDIQAGVVRSLGEYQRLFPGHEQRLAWIRDRSSRSGSAALAYLFALAGVVLTAVPAQTPVIDGIDFDPIAMLVGETDERALRIERRMEEAETLCDQLAIVDHGAIVASGTMTELRGMIGESDIVRLTGAFDPERAREALRALPDVEVVQAEPDALRLAVVGASKVLPELLGTLTAAGADVRETTMTQPNLESLFIKLTGKELRQ